MKKLVLLALVATALFSTITVHAKIRRVGFTGPTPISGVDYADLQSAHDSASAGDTLLMFPGSYSASFTKKLTVLGYGYFLSGTNPNTNLQNITGSLTFNVYLYAGASSSVFEGLDGINISPNYNEIVNNIVVRRCNGYVGFNDQVCQNWQVLQSYLTAISFQYSNGTAKNLTVNNCVVSNFNFTYGSANSTGQINNCIFYNTGTDFKNGAFICKNTIFTYVRPTNDLNTVYSNCIGVADYGGLPASNSNKNISATDMSSLVFVGFSNQGTYSNDGMWALAAGSPAKGAGAGGTDCGIFGGTNPYKLSGIPRIPAFYKLAAPSNTTSTNPYTITFSVRSNN